MTSPEDQLIANLTEQALVTLLTRLSVGDHYDVEFGQAKGEVSVIQLYHTIESLRKLRKDLQANPTATPQVRSQLTVSIDQIRKQVTTND